MAALRRAQPKQSKQVDKQSNAASAQLQQQALSTLLFAEATEQEAAERDIEVSEAEVLERWESVADAQFKTKKALRRFLGGQTEEDLLAQLRLQTLTERIHEQVSEEAGGGKKGARAIEEFQKDFQERWRERTGCSERYDNGCSPSTAR